MIINDLMYRIAKKIEGNIQKLEARIQYSEFFKL